MFPLPNDYQSFFLAVDIPNGRYSPQNPKIPVNKGMIPTKPHQLLNTTPAAPISKPTTILIILSVFPTLHFMALNF